VDDLETIDPTGVHLDRLLQWECCVCKNSRVVEINHHIPGETVRRAMFKDEIRGRIFKLLLSAVLALILTVPVVLPDLDAPEVQPDAVEVNWYRPAPRPSPGEVSWTRRMIEAESERGK
jgi:predicted nucleic acid-binding Zn ribbon protein